MQEKLLWTVLWTLQAQFFQCKIERINRPTRHVLLLSCMCFLYGQKHHENCWWITNLRQIFQLEILPEIHVAIRWRHVKQNMSCYCVSLFDFALEKTALALKLSCNLSRAKIKWITVARQVRGFNYGLLGWVHVSGLAENPARGNGFWSQNTEGVTQGVLTDKASPEGWVFSQVQQPMIKTYYSMFLHCNTAKLL